MRLKFQTAASYCGTAKTSEIIAAFKTIYGRLSGRDCMDYDGDFQPLEIVSKEMIVMSDSYSDGLCLWYLHHFSIVGKMAVRPLFPSFYFLF